MKRDFNLVRKILQDMEDAQPMRMCNGFTYDGYEEPTINEHVELLIEAGLLEGKVLRTQDSSMPIVSRLTWAGHDFLDAMKDESIWKKAQDSLLKPAGGVAFDVLLEWLKWQMKEKLGMPTD
jgi:hypothetical protein